MIYATSHALHKGEEAPVSIIEWKSWKLTRKCRSSLAAETQAMANSVDMLNFVRLFFADFLHADGIDLRRPDEVLKLLPESFAVTDCKSLYDALEKSESLGLGLSEKRTSIEVTATRQQMRNTGIKTRWVNSDRQLADVLTKATAPSASIQRLQNSGRWKIVFDATYTSAKNARKAKRDAHFKKVKDNPDPPPSDEIRSGQNPRYHHRLTLRSSDRSGNVRTPQAGYRHRPHQTSSSGR